MGAANLISKLMEIERAIGRARPVDVHALVLEAQSYVLEIQRQMIDTLRENARLRERMEKCEPVAVTRTREFLLPSNTEVARELSRRMRSVAEETAVPSLQQLAVS
jgi:hypothetical protein